MAARKCLSPSPEYHLKADRVFIYKPVKLSGCSRHSHSPFESVFATGGGYENHCSSHTVRKMGRGPAAILAKPLHHLATNLAV